MKNHRKLVILACGLVSLTSVHSEGLWSGMSVDEAIATAFNNNPELRLALLERERAESQMRRAGRFADPEVEVAYSSDRFGKDEGEGSLELAFTQQFPITSQLRKEKQLRLAQLVLAEAEIGEHRRQLAHRVEQAVIALGSTRREIEWLSELKGLNETMVKSLEDQVSRGEASSLDVTQMSLSGVGIGQAIKLRKRDARQQLAELKLLLGKPTHDELKVAHRFTLPQHLIRASDFSEELLAKRPDYVLALARIDEAGFAVELEKARRWSDVAVRVFVEQEEAVDEPGGVEENTIAGIGLSIPLPLFRGNRDSLAGAKLDRQATEVKRDALLFTIQSEYQEAVRLRQDAYELAKEMSSESIQLAEENYENLMVAANAGQASLLQVQQALEQLIEFEKVSSETSAAYFESEAQLRFIQGDYPDLQFKKQNQN